ncbi:MAG: hypothetical protein GY952_10110 [Rhodobacteraceae bacterium]|nr:hypothetical protein [Paracoccaceae bacterium]
MDILLNQIRVLVAALLLVHLVAIPSVANADGLRGRSIQIFGGLVVTACITECDRIEINLGASKFYVGKTGTNIYEYSAVDGGRIVKPGKWGASGSEITKIKVKGSTLLVYGKINFAQVTDFRVSFVASGSSCKVKVQTKRGNRVADTSFNHNKYSCQVTNGNIFAK